MAPERPAPRALDDLENRWQELLAFAIERAGDRYAGSQAFTRVVLAVYTTATPLPSSFDLFGSVAAELATSDPSRQSIDVADLSSVVAVLEHAVIQPGLVRDLVWSLRNVARRWDFEAVTNVASTSPTFLEELAFHVSRLPISSESLNKDSHLGILLESLARALCSNQSCSDRHDWVLEHVAGTMCGIINPRLEMSPCLVPMLFFRRADGQIRRDGLARRLNNTNSESAHRYFPSTDPAWAK